MSLNPELFKPPVMDSEADQINVRYELGRKAGLSHETATEMAAPIEHHGKPLTGYEWDIHEPELDENLKYRGPPPTPDAALWAGKLAISTSSDPRNPWAQTIAAMMANEGLPLITNTRCRMDDKGQGGNGGWWNDGMIRIDLELRHVGGRRTFTTVRLPISACINHDTRYCIKLLWKHLSGKFIHQIESTLMRETDMLHVHGG
jgi:hypothetical protein